MPSISKALAPLIVLAVLSCSSGKDKTPAAPERPVRTAQMSAELRDTMSPADVYQAFKDGHQRFIEEKPRYRSVVLEVQEAAAGQHPYAIVLSCIDSRVPVETIFDKQIGDIFGARVAGNVVNEDVLGGMEFATKLAGAKLIMVMGHTKCGAVKGAAAGVELGNLTQLLKRIEPAIERTAAVYRGKPDPTDYAYVDAIALENVKLAVEQIRQRSPELARMEQEGAIKIVGTMYDVSSGRVTFFE